MAVLHSLYCPDLAPVLFWELKLALKERRRGDINTIQEVSCCMQSKQWRRWKTYLLGTEHQRNAPCAEVNMAALLHQLKHLFMM